MFMQYKNWNKAGLLLTTNGIHFVISIRQKSTWIKAQIDKSSHKQMSTWTKTQIYICSLE